MKTYWTTYAISILLLLILAQIFGIRGFDLGVPMLGWLFTTFGMLLAIRTGAGRMEVAKLIVPSAILWIFVVAMGWGSDKSPIDIILHGCAGIGFTLTLSAWGYVLTRVTQRFQRPVLCGFAAAALSLLIIALVIRIRISLRN